MAALMGVLPPLVLYLWLCARHYQGSLVVPADAASWRALWAHVPAPTPAALAFTLAWFALQVALQAFAPGRVVQGTVLADGTRLDYRMNGLFSFVVTLALAVAAVASGALPATFLYDELGPLLVTMNLVAFGTSVWLYFHGRFFDRDESTGRPVHDYYMGTALNPRVGHFDLKLFFEARPGLILWVLINASQAAAQHAFHGTVSAAMLLVNAFQLLYVADYFVHESAILTTMDIKHEKFGWMLCWGNVVWVPFMYTLQAQYLVHHPHALGAAAIVGLIALNLTGYVIFRSVNLQKHRFRSNPERPIWGRPPEYIRTARGTLLLMSGWWGLARHFNYAGDLLMALAWCLPAGLTHVLPWFYFVYFAILLVHRERRDHALCLARYGDDWRRYCERVRWRIIPGVY